MRTHLLPAVVEPGANWEGLRHNFDLHSFESDQAPLAGTEKLIFDMTCDHIARLGLFVPNVMPGAAGLALTERPIDNPAATDYGDWILKHWAAIMAGLIMLSKTEGRGKAA